MAELFVSRRAEKELDEIWHFIAADDRSAADRLLRRIGGKLQLLRSSPSMGTLRDDIRPGFRMLIESSYLLLYEHDVANDSIELVAVVDGRRDLSDLF